MWFPLALRCNAHNGRANPHRCTRRECMRSLDFLEIDLDGARRITTVFWKNKRSKRAAVHENCMHEARQTTPIDKERQPPPMRRIRDEGETGGSQDAAQQWSPRRHLFSSNLRRPDDSPIEHDDPQSESKQRRSDCDPEHDNQLHQFAGVAVRTMTVALRSQERTR